MTRRRVLEIALVVVLVGAAWAHGRAAAPTREIRTVDVQHHERVVYRDRVEATASSRAREVRVVGPVVTRWRTVPGPGCTGQTVEVERIEGASETTRATSTDTRLESQREATETRDHVRTEVQVVERARPRFAVGVDGGLRFADAVAVVRGRFEVRPLGDAPFWVGAWADKAGAGGGVRVEW